MSVKLCIPTRVLDQHLVILGKTGAGKSSALRHIVEHLLTLNKRVCIIDPKGDWWGLKSSADGKAAGFPVIAFGDFKNSKATDVPLNDQSGKHVAELVATGNRPCLVGMRGWTQGSMTRFWIDFAGTLFNQNAGELYLVVDEFHNFAPKGKILSPEAGMALHWSNRLLSEGRGLGIVCLNASQRPQKVHNDSLTSHETLVAMRVIHKADRDAIKDWIDGAGDPEKGKEVLNTLAAMPRGEAFVWSPEIGFGPQRLAFPMFTTFDSFAPPQLQRKVSESGWADVNLETVKDKLARVIEEAKANDPKLLKAEIATLKRQLSARPTEQVEKVVEKIVEVPVLKNGQLDRTEKAQQRLEQFGEKLLAEAAELRRLIAPASAPRPVAHAPTGFKFSRQGGAAAKAAVKHAAPIEVGDLKISSTQQRILDALAWYESLGNDRPRLTQVGAVACIDPTGGHFSNVVGPLSTAGLVIRGDGVLTLTDAGRGVATAPEDAGTLDEYHDVLRARVRKMKSAGGKTIEMLNTIIEADGEPLTVAQIGEAVGIDSTGGHFSNMIGPLGTAGLIERQSGTVTATEVLFPPGLKKSR